MGNERVTQCQHCGKDMVEVAVKPRDISVIAFLRLGDAYRAAKSNEECAEILRIFCNDGDLFWRKYGKEGDCVPQVV